MFTGAMVDFSWWECDKTVRTTILACSETVHSFSCTTCTGRNVISTASAGYQCVCVCVCVCVITNVCYTQAHSQPQYGGMGHRTNYGGSSCLH